MFKIRGKNIELTRGDSCIFEVTVLNGNEPYILLDGDIVRFTVKKDEYKAEALVQKTRTNADYADDNRLAIKILPSDTKNLKYGEYVYDVEVTRDYGQTVDTIIKGEFILLEEVSY